MHSKPLFTDYQPRGGRYPPTELVRLLREVDETAELIYAGTGLWLLGSFRPNRENEVKAINMISTLRRLQAVIGRGKVVIPKHVKQAVAFRLWRYELYRQGFRSIARYRVQGEPTSAIHEDLRVRTWRAQNHLDETIAAIEEAADADLEAATQLKKLQKYIHDEGPAIHRHAFRTPKLIIPSNVRHRKRSLA